MRPDFDRSMISFWNTCLGLAYFSAALAIAESCRAVLDDTEHKERLQALLQRDLSDTEGILDLCSLRGWTLAFEAGCACLPDDAALAMWKKSFSSCLSVSLSLETPISREAEKRQVKLDAWRRSMSLLFTSIAKGKLPGTDSVAAQLANSDEHLIPASLHVCFDASRLLRDAELLRIAVDELDSRIDAGSIRSQTELLGLRVASARAAAALGDHERLAKFTLSCLELFPEAADEPLRDHEWDNAVLPYELELAFANDADPAILRRISDVTVNNERREQRRKLHVLGGLWVLGGGDKGELQRTRKNFSQPTDLEGFVFGMGLVAGSRQSKLSAVQIWILGDNEQLFTNRREIEFFLFGIAAQRQRSWTGLSRIEPDWSERLILALQAKTKTK